MASRNLLRSDGPPSQNLVSGVREESRSSYTCNFFFCFGGTRSYDVLLLLDSLDEMADGIITDEDKRFLRRSLIVSLLHTAAALPMGT